MMEDLEVKAEVWLPNMNDATDVVSCREENFQTEWSSNVKEEIGHQIKIKSESPDLDYDTTYDDSIKLELLHEEFLNIKTEILSNHEEQTISEPFEKKLFGYSLEHPTTCISTVQKPSNPLTSEPPLKCYIRNSEALQKIDSHHQHVKLINPKEKRFKCDICTYTGSRYRLKRHMKVHTGEKPFKCTLCNYASTEKCNLDVHMTTHTGEKSFKCCSCSYASLRKSSLKSHMKTHTGEKPFKCNACSYASVQNYLLKRHMKTHTGEKPFDCGVCSYACADKSKLKRHLKTHIGEKLFK